MPPRNSNNTFLDKFLGIFGIKRPKTKKKAVSKRKNVRVNPNTDYNNGFEIPLNDNYQIISGNTTAQNSRNNKSRQSSGNSTARKATSANSSVKQNVANKKHTDKKQPANVKLKKNGKPKKRHPILHAILSFMLVLVITMCIIAGVVLFWAISFINDPGDDIIADVDLYNIKLEYTSILYAEDSNGKEVELARLHGDENRLWVDYDDIPKSVRYAFISCEDKRFNEHSGVDWKRTISATANEVFGFYGNRQGGSTITQQLVKNITKDDETNWSRKIREILRALYIEEHYDKDTILECYLNTIHLGNGVDGVEVAANYYFDKNVSDLNITQAACLAAITNNPSENEPYKHAETNKNRRNWVIDEMYNNGYITKSECEEAKKADLQLRENPSTVLSTTKTVKNEKFNSYFVDAVIEDVIQGLVEEKGYTKEYAEAQLYKGGYKIYTTVDLDMQEKLENVYKSDEAFQYVYSESGDKVQSAMTIMDYKGNVKAIVGGRGEKKANRTLNRATQSPRPPGSSIKPISAYAPAFEYNIITWGTTIEDSPVEKLENGVVPDEKWPKNYSDSYSYSKTTMLYALQQSLNTIPVKLVQEMTLDTSYKFVTEKMGLKHFTENENGQSDKTESSLGVGGSVHGATTLEMAAAFSTFGNGGIYYQPKTYTKILDQNNEVVIDLSDKKHRAISAGTAGIMCKMLQTVATDGTGKSAQFGDWEIMCKTGTTSDKKDRWFVGGTSYYMAACWVGCDEPSRLSVSYNSPETNPAITIWKAAMSAIHEDLENKDFEISEEAEYRKYCTTSGMCAKTGCSSVAYGYFKSSYTPYCTYHYGSEIGKSEHSDNDYYGYYSYNSSDDDEEETTKSKNEEKTENTDSSEATSATKADTDETTAGTTEAPETTGAPPNTEEPKTSKAQKTEPTKKPA